MQAVQRANILRYIALAAGRTGADDAAELEKTHADCIAALWEKHPEESTVATAYMSAQFSSLSGLARKEPYEAKEKLEALKKTLVDIEEAGKIPAAITKNFTRSVTSLERKIEGARKHYDMIGQPSVALDVEAWVNGAALTDDELKGKVVLLDFWAVWCGPCIATFPHLREWQEEYGDKGLVIIGMTRYYNYSWDEKAGRATRSKTSVEPAVENEMLEKFAALHDLHHRFAVTPKTSKFQSAYGVRGIPQAVLIDQEGKIRLIHVGSGPANAKDISNELKKLLGD